MTWPHGSHRIGRDRELTKIESLILEADGLEGRPYRLRSLDNGAGVRFAPGEWILRGDRALYVDARVFQEGEWMP